MAPKYFTFILLNILNIHYVVGQISDKGLNSASTESIESLVERKITSSLSKLEENIIRQLEVMQHDNRNWRSMAMKQITELEENMKTKLKTLETIPELVENMKNKIDSLEKRMPELQQNMDTKLDKIPELVENIKHKTDVLEKKMPELEQSMEIKLNGLEKIPELVENMKNKIDNLETRMPESQQNMEAKLNALEKIPESIHNMKKRLNLLGCKVFLPAHRTFPQIYPIAHESLRHVTLIKDYNDDVIYFEMHIAIKGAEDAGILLSSAVNPHAVSAFPSFVIGVGINSNKKTIMERNFLVRPPVKVVHTPDVLSANDYINFYIKISNGTLAFGKVGDNSPLLTYDSSELSEVKYIGFTYLHDEVKFLYDCPAVDDYF